ncbi:hypothetical protein KY345_06685 [Candidatus Woesearchaeota archaeon]|nr:hypothetical protein [Candidatus Woesearchaeota archaeon]
MGAVKTEYKEVSAEVIDKIIEQYRRCIRALNGMFKHAPDECYEDDGIGCCCETHHSYGLLEGPAADKIVDMQEEKANYDSLPDACLFHKEGEGCVLGDLKSPACISHYCRGELPRRYDRIFVQDILSQVLCGSPGPDSYHPEENEHLVSALERYAQEMIEEIEDLREKGMLQSFEFCP